MDKQSSIIVTGAAGFIGSCMIQFLNEQGFENLIIVDDFGEEDKRVNWEGKEYAKKIERHYLFDWLDKEKPHIDYIIHIGARTDTTEFNYEIHRELNLNYTLFLWKYCVEFKIPFIYASSAATYGAGEFGYNDDHGIIDKLQPLNPYGVSKNEFDKWAIKQKYQPPFWIGLKFFNVYGPNEYHKGRMASVIWHSFNQIKKDGIVKLFKSHKDEFKDGEQLRDFVYVKDVISVIFWLMEEGNKLIGKTDGDTKVKSGIYNLGTGKARAFKDLVKATFAGIDKTSNIEYIDMPLDIRDKYQYFTEANMQKLRDAGYAKEFYSLEKGVDDYVRNYLKDLKLY
jgi:ADP-L-glycero-D-manno-heptose 6-epimerase